MERDEGKIYFSEISDSIGQFMSGRAILGYHKIAPRPTGVKWRSLYLSPKLFARQMEQLASAGFTTATLDEPRETGKNSPRRFVITFDDGYVNVLRHAAPVLARHGFRAIQFIVAGSIGGTNHWDVREGGEVEEPLMNEAEIREWLAQGHEIGSHSVTHRRLTRLGAPERREEILASKKRLEDQFGVPIRHFCYPYGDFDSAVSDTVRDCGYETACTQIGGVNLAHTDPFTLRRIEGRYPKRSPRAIWQRFWKRWFSRDTTGTA